MKTKYIFVVFLFFLNCGKSIEFHDRKYKLGYFAKQKAISLSQEHCTTCHILPLPTELDRETWGYVLGYMGLLLGIEDTATLKHDAGFVEHWKNRRELLRVLKEIPSQPKINKEEWSLIKSYYLINSAVSLPYAPARPIKSSKDYSVQKYPIEIDDIAITLIHQQDDTLFVGTAWEPRLFRFPTNAAHKDKVNPTSIQRVPSPPVFLYKEDNVQYLTLLGDLLGNRPLEDPAELWVSKTPKARFKPFLDKMPRTAMILPWANGFIVPGFGVGRSGGLLYITEKKRKVYSNSEGYVAAKRLDLNGDNRPDILALVANSQESLRMFLSVPKNPEKVKEHILQEFSSTCGFTRMIIADINNDGDEEIILSAGDNPDAGPYNPPKPCHGVYIYRLEKTKACKKQSREQCPLPKVELIHFEPLAGAYGIAVSNFGRGGLSSVIIGSFFPDISKENMISLAVLEQTNKNSFKLLQIPLKRRISLVEPIRVKRKNGVQTKEAILLSAPSLPLIQKGNGANGQKIIRKDFLPKDGGIYILEKK